VDLEPGDHRRAVSVPGHRHTWGKRLMVALMVLITVGTIGFVAVNAARLGGVTAQVQSVQARSTNVANADRESLVLLQLVGELGETTTSKQVAVQRGLMVRQMIVATTSYPAGSAEVLELDDIRATVARFPWAELDAELASAPDPARSPLKLACLTMVRHTELRLNSLRNAEEHRFYSVTSRALDSNERSQVGLSLLVAVVLAMGSICVYAVTRRRRAAEEALRRSEARFRSLVQRASDLTVVTDAAGVITYISPAAETLLGYRPAELTTLPLLVHVEPTSRDDVSAAITQLTDEPGRERTIELRLFTRDGRMRLVEAVCQNLLDDPDVGGLVWNGRDVTDRRALEDELTHQASHDPLTGLPNRTLMLSRLDTAIRSRAGRDGGVSVILVDLDGFKNVNDTLGHSAGDELLQAAAKRLLGTLRDGDTAARLGGDEFAVVAQAEPRQAVAAGQRIVEKLRQPFRVAGHDVRVGASVGVAHASATGSAEDLVRDADIAMYVAKHTGKGRAEVFEPDMRIRASRRNELLQELARAVELHQIEVVFQPIIDLKTFRPKLLEALARWRRTDGSLMSPDDFIPAAEESGAIIELGREVLRQSCRAVQLWRLLPGYGDLAVAVNVSVHQVLSGRLVDHAVEALQESGLPGSHLILEITESAELEDSQRVAAELGRLRELGIRIAVDDFGAGYSSLGFLMGLGADVLKIDRTLLDFVTTRRGSLVTAIAELGRTLDLMVIVEGVETPDHLARAREAACDAAQGYHFSHPLPFDQVADHLLSWPDRTVVPGELSAPTPVT
jgi:diguanylate cyclase (GGDEF)-like protein/PAS domain S-box-containing protein